MKIYFLAISILYNNTSWAQDTLYMTSNDAIAIALEKSYSIRSFIVEKESMQQYFGYYKAMFKPKLNLALHTPLWQEAITQINRPDGLPVYNSTGLLRAGMNLTFTYVLPSGGELSVSGNMCREHLSTILASDHSKHQTEQFSSYFGLTLSQPVFTKNTLRENLKEAEYRFLKSEQYYTRAQMDIVFQVTQGFYYLFRFRKQAEIMLERLGNSEESLRLARLKSKGGRVAQGDVISAEVSVARNKAAYLRAVNQFHNEEEQFKQLIGLDLNRTIGIVTDFGYKTLIIDEDNAVEAALNNRPELKETDMDINLQQIEVDRARREGEFKGYISAYYDLTGISTLGSGSISELAGSSFDDIGNRPPNRGVALTITFPLYDWGRGASRVREARLRLQSKLMYKEDQEITIRREVREIIRSVKESAEQLEMHRQNLELARQSYHISQMRFENGDISSQDLTIEQERLANIQFEYLDAYIQYQLAVNDLKRKTMLDFEGTRDEGQGTRDEQIVGTSELLNN